MALTQRKGWIRLGVVLSVAWIVGVLIYAVLEHYSVRGDLTTSINLPEPSSPPVVSHWEIVGQQSFLTDCDVKQKQVSCSPRFTNLALLSLLPIISCWLIAVLVVYAVRWVRAGFRSDET